MNREDDSEAMMEGMAHGVEAYNEAIGSPLVAGYCDECGLEQAAGHHGCRCDDEPVAYDGDDSYNDGERGYWE